MKGTITGDVVGVTGYTGKKGAITGSIRKIR